MYAYRTPADATIGGVLKKVTTKYEEKGMGEKN
jgi:hypothetical protein